MHRNDVDKPTQPYSRTPPGCSGVELGRQERPQGGRRIWKYRHPRVVSSRSLHTPTTPRRTPARNKPHLQESLCISWTARTTAALDFYTLLIHKNKAQRCPSVHQSFNANNAFENTARLSVLGDARVWQWLIVLDRSSIGRSIHQATRASSGKERKKRTTGYRRRHAQQVFLLPPLFPSPLTK